MANKYGVKIWSKDAVRNPQFLKECVAHVREGFFDYVELFALAGSYNDTSSLLYKELNGLPVVIHAPHSGVGMDLGNKEMQPQNRIMLADSLKFADLFKAEIIILHAGIGQGEQYFNESIRQFRLINDQRLAVENQPYECCVTHRLLHGVTPDEIRIIQNETGCKFCLDFYHAVCAANNLGYKVEDYWRQFNGMVPDMYHLCDGYMDGKEDVHLHYGEGKIDLAALLRDFVHPNSMLTMETGREVPQTAEPWVRDAEYIRAKEAEI